MKLLTILSSVFLMSLNLSADPSEVNLYYQYGNDYTAVDSDNLWDAYYEYGLCYMGDIEKVANFQFSTGATFESQKEDLYVRVSKIKIKNDEILIDVDVYSFYSELFLEEDQIVATKCD